MFSIILSHAIVTMPCDKNNIQYGYGTPCMKYNSKYIMHIIDINNTS